MKDASIFDGTAWQSLKGPPGPSAVSADAGNTLALGSDGLHFTTAPPDSEAYVWCKHGDDPQARYDLAKTLTPNGQPLSATNRATLIILPGTYGGKIKIDANFVDVFGMCQQPRNPAVWLEGVRVTAAVVHVSGLGVTLNRSPEEAMTREDTFAVVGAAGQSFTNCVGGAGSFGVFSNSLGFHSNCVGGRSSFGRGARAAGTYIDCVADADCFGDTAEGLFLRCTAGQNSFGVPTASGKFEDCTGGDRCFGQAGTQVNPLFGFHGEASGCVAGFDSFGGGVSQIGATARIVLCQLRAGTFKTPVAGGLIRYCIDGNFTTVNIP